MAEGASKQRVFQIAKELKVQTQTIVDYLDSLGYDMVRQQMSLVTEEMYRDCLQKFDKVTYQRYLAEMVESLEKDKQKDTDELRQAELEKIIASKSETSATSPFKIGLPDHQLVIVKAAEKKKVELRPIEIPEDEAVKLEKSGKGKRKKPLKAKKEKAKRPAAEEPEEAEVIKVAKPVEMVSTVEETAEVKKPPKRKIGLPAAEPLKIVKKAPEKGEPKAVQKPLEKAKAKIEEPEAPKKPIARRKLKRKRIPTEVKTTAEAIETSIESKLRKKTEKLEKLKSQGKKGVTVSATQPSKRKRRRRKSREAAPAEPVREGRGRKRRKVDAKEVAATIKQTFAQLSGATKATKRYAKGQIKDDSITESIVMKVAEFITAQEFASIIEIPVQEVIKVGLEMGMIISINQRLDRDTIEMLASEFSIDIEFVHEEIYDDEEELVTEENLAKRSPVVTIMGHVDHGKTTLLDYLRRTHVAESEAGGITQHIGAYEVAHKTERITFLDTPGHEAFTAMRARGAQVTDIVVLVIAADDHVMPQTLEAIDHAKAADVPIIIAINKIDKPSANSEAIYKQLADKNILVEKWGGKYQSAEISAKLGQGIDDLLGEILVAAEILDLKGDPTSRARGVVIESRLDRGLGAVATILIKTGTLRIHDPFAIGQYFGRVRAMYDEVGVQKEEAGPSTPVQVVGFDGIPQAGDRMLVYPNEKEAREVAQRRQRQYREISLRQIKSITLDQVNRQMREMELKELALIIKGDVHGSVEVLSDALMKLSTPEVKVCIIHRGVGGITESDVLLAAASQSIIIGFHVHPNSQSREVARREGVEIRLYRVIHDVVNDVHNSLEGLLAPTHEERFIGSIEIRKVFKISRIGSIAGCYVTDGKVNRNSKVRLIRDNVELWLGELDSLKRFKEDAREVLSGFECGLSLNGYNDIRIGDRVEVFEEVELARKLEDTL